MRSIKEGGKAGGGGLFIRRTQVTRRHLPRSLPIQTQGNGSQPRSHGAPYRGDHGSRLVRHGPGFLAGAEVDGIGGRGGGGRVRWISIDIFDGEFVGFVARDHEWYSEEKKTTITAAVKAVSTSDSPTRMDLEAVMICMDLRCAVHLRSRLDGRTNKFVRF